MSYDEYAELINHGLPPEAPSLFGLPSNAEINFLSAEADFTFKFVWNPAAVFSSSLRAVWALSFLLYFFPSLLTFSCAFFFFSPSTPLNSTVMELSGASGGAGGESKESRVRAIVEDIMARIPDNPLDMMDINARVELRTPYVLVCLQVWRAHSSSRHALVCVCVCVVIPLCFSMPLSRPSLFRCLFVRRNASA